MNMFDVGRVVVKIAGRDAGKKAVIIDVLDRNYVLIDGATRRRKVNMSHLEPLPQTLEIEKGASHEEVAKLFKAAGLPMRETKPKAKAARPMEKRKGKGAAPLVKQEKKVKKAEKMKKAKKGEIAEEKEASEKKTVEAAEEAEKPKKKKVKEE